MVGLGVDFKLWEKYLTPTATFNASQTLHSASSIGTTSITSISKGLAKCFLARRLSYLRCSGQYAMLHCTLKQTNPVHSFRALRFPIQHAYNQPRTQHSHFRGPQNSNN